MNISIRNSCSLVIILSLLTASPSYALNRFHTGLIGAGAMAATILAIEHLLIPFLTELSNSSPAKQQAAEFAHNQEEIEAMEQQYEQEEPLDSEGNSDDLLAAKQKTTADLQLVQSLMDFYKPSKTENAQAFLKEIEKCKHAVQHRNDALDQAIAKSIAQEACAAYKDELEALKSHSGLSAEQIKQIIVEKYVRDPYRHHTYLKHLDEFISRCKHYHVPATITSSLEQTLKAASRATASDIETERHEREAAAHREQEFNVKMANERSTKEFFDAAKQELAQLHASVDKSHEQLAQCEQLIQNQSINGEHAMAACTTAAHNASATLQQVNNEQQQLRQQLGQVGELIRDQSAQTQSAIRTILSHLLAQQQNDHQQSGYQGYAGPSAPPFEA